MAPRLVVHRPPVSRDGGGVTGVWIVAALRDQARWCARLGSRLYADILTRAAEDAVAGGPVRARLAPHAGRGTDGALALRLMAAVHRLVLSGGAPDLAAHYPSAGGTPRFPAVWSCFRELLVERASEIEALVGEPCQTNEVGRSAALAAGFLRVAAATARPLRLLEVGASAGLNLRWDRFFYSGGGARWGDPASPVRLEGFWEWPPPDLGASLDVVERRGCDPAPIDPLSPSGALSLRSSVWADQPERLERLDGALELARRIPARVDAASAESWVPERLQEACAGATSVVYQSVVDEYLSEKVRRGLRAAIEDAGRRATPARPLAWLRLERRPHAVGLELSLESWPGSERVRLATCGGHGAGVRWV